MKREYCAEFDSTDPRFSYENDGCSPCTNRRKYPPPTTIYLQPPVFQKCLKGHTVKNYVFREEALKRSLKKQKNFVIQVKLPNEVTSDVLREKLERVLESEVQILMEGIGTRGAGFIDSEFSGADELEALGFTPHNDLEVLEEPESVPEEEPLGEKPDPQESKQEDEQPS